MVAERRAFLDGANVVAAYAEEMSEFLRSSELTENKGVHSVLCEGSGGQAGQRGHRLHHPHAG